MGVYFAAARRSADRGRRADDVAGIVGVFEARMAKVPDASRPADDRRPARRRVRVTVRGVNDRAAGERATRPLVVARAIRAFADGFASVLLARYLQHLGFSGFQIGAIITATLLGSAAVTLWAGLRLNRWGAQRVLFASCLADGPHRRRVRDGDPVRAAARRRVRRAR